MPKVKLPYGMSENMMLIAQIEVEAKKNKCKHYGQLVAKKDLSNLKVAEKPKKVKYCKICGAKLGDVSANKQFCEACALDRFSQRNREAYRKKKEAKK